MEQAILFEAFRGELVTRDPNDEPASVLLERPSKVKRRQGKLPHEISNKHPKCTPLHPHRAGGSVRLMSSSTAHHFVHQRLQAVRASLGRIWIDSH
jgi:hypothetical protein